MSSRGTEKNQKSAGEPQVIYYNFYVHDVQ